MSEINQDLSGSDGKASNLETTQSVSGGRSVEENLSTNDRMLRDLVQSRERKSKSRVVEPDHSSTKQTDDEPSRAGETEQVAAAKEEDPTSEGTKTIDFHVFKREMEKREQKFDKERQAHITTATELRKFKQGYSMLKQENQTLKQKVPAPNPNDRQGMEHAKEVSQLRAKIAELELGTFSKDLENDVRKEFDERYSKESQVEKREEIRSNLLSEATTLSDKYHGIVSVIEILHLVESEANRGNEISLAEVAKAIAEPRLKKVMQSQVPSQPKAPRASSEVKEKVERSSVSTNDDVLFQDMMKFVKDKQARRVK